MELSDLVKRTKLIKIDAKIIFEYDMTGVNVYSDQIDACKYMHETLQKMTPLKIFCLMDLRNSYITEPFAIQLENYIKLCSPIMKGSAIIVDDIKTQNILKELFDSLNLKKTALFSDANKAKEFIFKL